MRVYGGVVGGDVGIGSTTVPHSGIVVCNAYILVRTALRMGSGQAHTPQRSQVPWLQDVPFGNNG